VDATARLLVIIFSGVGTRRGLYRESKRKNAILGLKTLAIWNDSRKGIVLRM